MWATRQQHLGLRHTMGVPRALRAALQEGEDPPCPVSRYALYQAAQGTTVVLSNRDSGVAVELYATPREGQEGLLRGAAADLIDGLYCGGGGVAGCGVPEDGALAVQIFSELDGSHLVTAVRGPPGADDGAPGSVDATVALACSESEGGQRCYRHVRTRRRRKRIVL